MRTKTGFIEIRLSKPQREFILGCGGLDPELERRLSAPSGADWNFAGLTRAQLDDVLDILTAEAQECEDPMRLRQLEKLYEKLECIETAAAE